MVNGKWYLVSGSWSVTWIIPWIWSPDLGLMVLPWVTPWTLDLVLGFWIWITPWILDPGSGIWYLVCDLDNTLDPGSGIWFLDLDNTQNLVSGIWSLVSGSGFMVLPWIKTMVCDLDPWSVTLAYMVSGSWYLVCNLDPNLGPWTLDSG